MPQRPCAVTEDGVHILSRDGLRTELLPLGGLDIIAVGARCAACGLHCAWIVDVPAELSWTTDPRSLDEVARRWTKLVPKAKLTLIDGGKKQD